MPLAIPYTSKHRDYCQPVEPRTSINSQNSDEQAREDSCKKMQLSADRNTAIKMGLFGSAIFIYFSELASAPAFLASILKFMLFPVWLFIEAFDVVVDIGILIRTKKATAQHWISLGVNLLKLAGVGVVAGLSFAGIAAAGSALAPVAAAAFVLGYGAKTLWHAGTAVYSVVKSFDSTLTKQQKSDLHHEAFNHTVKAGFSAAITVFGAFVIAKASLVLATVGMLTGLVGTIAAWGLYYKDYSRHKNAEKKYKYSRDDDSSLEKHYDLKQFVPSPSYAPKNANQSYYDAPQNLPVQKDWRNYSSTPSFAQNRSGATLYSPTVRKDIAQNPFAPNENPKLGMHNSSPPTR